MKNKKGKISRKRKVKAEIGRDLWSPQVTTRQKLLSQDKRTRNPRNNFWNEFKSNPHEPTLDFSKAKERIKTPPQLQIFKNSTISSQNSPFPSSRPFSPQIPKSDRFYACSPTTTIKTPSSPVPKQTPIIIKKFPFSADKTFSTVIKNPQNFHKAKITTFKVFVWFTYRAQF